MHLLYMLLIGLLIGALAKAAGFIGRQTGWYTPDEPVDFFASVGGAVLLLVAYRLIIARRAE